MAFIQIIFKAVSDFKQKTETEKLCFPRSLKQPTSQFPVKTARQFILFHIQKIYINNLISLFKK